MRPPSILAFTGIYTGIAIATISVGSADTRAANGQVGPQDLKIIAQAADPSSANRKKRPPAAGLQIACTRVGCNPIPRGCTIEKEYGWDGLPTGYDLVVCPR